jgi:hypothetical protein
MTDSLDLRALALDMSLDDVCRTQALSALRAADASIARDVALIIADRAEESENLLRAVGFELARLGAAGTEVTEWDLRDMTDAAFKAFCEWVPAHDA